MAELLPEDRIFATLVRKALLRISEEQKLPLTEDDLGNMKFGILKVLQDRRDAIAAAETQGT
jgi:hypothetical protein